MSKNIIFSTIPKKRYALIDDEGWLEKPEFMKTNELSNVYRGWIGASFPWDPVQTAAMERCSKR